MATATHESGPVPAQRRWSSRLLVPQMWASLAICVIWLAVLADALFGPDIVSSNASGFARVPSAIVLAFFAWLATWVIAKHGFHKEEP